MCPRKRRPQRADLGAPGPTRQRAAELLRALDEEIAREGGASNPLPADLRSAREQHTLEVDLD
jgi:hypothetical protein